MKREEQGKKIKIAFYTPNAYSLFYQETSWGFGGAEVDMYLLALYLSRNPRYHVDFYIGDFGDSPQIDEYQGVTLRKIKYFGWTGKSLPQALSHYYHLFKDMYFSSSNIAITEMANAMPGWTAVFYRILRRKVTIHRLASDRDALYDSPKWAHKPMDYYLYRLGLNKANCIIAQSLHQQTLLKKHMGLDSVVIPNGFFIRKEIQFEKKEHILWVGRQVAVKQPELFIELVKNIPNKKFVMIMPKKGQGSSEEFQKKVQEFLLEANKLPNFSYHEYVPFAQIQEYFDKALAFVNTSEYEGFPNTFVQACMGGTPIISLNVNPDGFVQRHQLGYFAQGSMEAMENFILNMDLESVKRMGSNALEYIRTNHDMEKIGKQYEEIIEDMIKKYT